MISSGLRNSWPFLLVLLVFLTVGWHCPVRYGLGITCPGCGFTRASVLLLRGDVAGSLQQHALVIPTGLLALWWFLDRKRREGILLGWGLLMVAYWLVRGVQFEPGAILPGLILEVLHG